MENGPALRHFITSLPTCIYTSKTLFAFSPHFAQNGSQNSPVDPLVFVAMAKIARHYRVPATGRLACWGQDRWFTLVQLRILTGVNSDVGMGWMDWVTGFESWDRALTETNRHFDESDDKPMDFGSCGYTIFMPRSWQNIPSFAGEAASSSALHRHHLVDFPEKRHTKMSTFHDDRLLDIELRHFPTHAKRCLDVFALASKVVGSIDWQPTTKLWAFAITMLSQISPVLLIWYIDYGNGRKTMPHRKWFTVCSM